MTAVVRYPIAAFLISLAATVAALAGLPKLTFDDGLSAAFRSGNPEFVRFENFRERFAISGAEFAVHLYAADFTAPERLDAARDFVLAIGTFEAVVQRVSIFSLRDPPASDGEAGSPLFAFETATAAENERSLAAAAAHPLNSGRLITADLQNLLVAIRLADDSQNAVAAFLTDLEDLAGEMLSPAGIGFAMAGSAVLRTRVIEDIIHDQTVINALGAAIGFGLCLFLFRTLPAALNAGLPATVALTWVLGSLGHSGIGINTLTNSLPVLIMVLAFADSMHLTYERLRARDRGLGGARAVAEALKIAGPPCLMTSLTTGLAFASLLFSGSQLVRSFAVAGMAAVAMTFVAVITVNPLVALVIGKFSGNRQEPAKENGPLRFPLRAWSGLLETVLRRRGPVCLAGMAVLIGAAIAYSQVSPRFSVLENINASAPELESHRTVEKLFAPMATIDTVLETGGANTAFSSDALSRAGLVHDSLARRFGDKNVVSVWTLAKWLDPANPHNTGERLARIANGGDNAGLAMFVTPARDALRIAVATPETFSAQVRKTVAEIETLVAEAVRDRPGTVETGGFLAMTAVVSPIMINELGYGFLAAAAMSGVIIGLWCRRLWVGVLALAVNVLPILLAGAWLWASGAGLQFASALALTIAFGIAVDDTLHVLSRLRPVLLAGGYPSQAKIRKTFIEITPVLFATTLILVCGLGAALISSIPTIVLFVQLSIGVLVVALVADVLLLPAMVSVWARRSKGGAAR